MVKYVVGDNLKREYMAMLWFAEDILGQDNRDLLVLHHRMNHFNFKLLIRLSKRVIMLKILARSESFSLARPVFLGSTTRGHGGSKSIINVDQSVKTHKLDPGP